MRLLVVALVGGVASVFGVQRANSQSCDQDASVRFTEQAESLGVRFHHQAHHSSMSYPLEVMGAGVALFDYDNDGRLDIFFANGASFPDPNPTKQEPHKDSPADWNRLFHQKADGTFEDVTEKAGVSGEGYAMGVAVGDYDNDGNEDLFVAGFPHSHLYHNNGNGTFTDVTQQAGVSGDGWATSAAWVDLDQDGRLDLIVLRYFVWNFDDRDCPTPDGKRSYCDPKIFPPIVPLVYHNDGDGHFTEVAQKIGMGKPGKGLGLAIADYNRDGKIDVFVANDGMDEFLYRNKGNGTFEETGVAANVATDDNGRDFAGMGVVFQDLNNDGLPDLLIGDLALQTFSLYRNRGDGSFDYASATDGLTRLTMAHSAWGLATIDSDNRGMQDVVAARGHVNVDIRKDNPQLNYLEPPMLLRNTGRGYRDASSCLGAIATEAFAGRGLAVGDIDNDGREDGVMTANDERAYVMHNESPAQNHWISIQLVGTSSNRDGIGAEVRVSTERGAQTKTVTTSGSYESSGDKRVHFGLGDAATLHSVDVTWPSGRHEAVALSLVDRFYVITEGKGITSTSCGNHPCFTAPGTKAGVSSGDRKQ
ncbi:MAG TPA: CRTAC1 family protein [Terracidiphilus sp.]|nr:CRTAC1 family protein [Terracidiphilus sp.]